MIFDYPQQVHRRRHAPSGYVNYRSFKPWLRDEFDFRCTYCLWRERWCATGEAAFSVDHLQPQAAAPQRICDYDNIVYACCRCNSAKADAKVHLDPCREAFGRHMRVLANGQIQGLSPDARELVRVCKLDAALLTVSRRRMLELHDTY